MKHYNICGIVCTDKEQNISKLNSSNKEVPVGLGLESITSLDQTFLISSIKDIRSKYNHITFIIGSKTLEDIKKAKGLCDVITELNYANIIVINSDTIKHSVFSYSLSHNEYNETIVSETYYDKNDKRDRQNELQRMLTKVKFESSTFFEDNHAFIVLGGKYTYELFRGQYDKVYQSTITNNINNAFNPVDLGVSIYTSTNIYEDDDIKLTKYYRV